MVRAATIPAQTPESDGAADDGQAVNLGPLHGLVGYHLRRAFAVLRSDYARAVEAPGLRQVLFGIVSVIAANDGINQTRVARVLGIQRANMVALVNELVAMGLVLRAVDPADGRAFLLTLTAAGEAARDATLARIDCHEQRLLNGTTADERAVLIGLLDRIQANGA